MILRRVLFVLMHLMNKKRWIIRDECYERRFIYANFIRALYLSVINYFATLAKDYEFAFLENLITIRAPSKKT